MRVLKKIQALDVDVVLIDIGAGTSFNILDFFLISDVSILTVVPEPSSALLSLVALGAVRGATQRRRPTA